MYISKWCGKDPRDVATMTEDRIEQRRFATSSYGPCWPWDQKKKQDVQLVLFTWGRLWTATYTCVNGQFPGRPGQGGTRMPNHSWFHYSNRQRWWQPDCEPYANRLHLAPIKSSSPGYQRSGVSPSFCPIIGVKSLMATDCECGLMPIVCQFMLYFSFHSLFSVM